MTGSAESGAARSVREHRLFIGGEWVEGAAATEVRSPFDGEVVGVVHRADAALVERAITAGQAAEDRMAGLSSHERREIVRAVANGLEARFEGIAGCIRDEAGKPIAIARGEVRRAIETFEFAAEAAWRMGEESIELDAVPSGRGRFGIVRRVPVGLVSAISPFNFPLNLVAHKLAPALAAGCPTVLKPASRTPITSLLLGEICAEAGVPPGGFNVVPCSRDAADAFTTDPRFKLLSFTGSPGVGWAMKDRAGRKKVVLELGGNAAVIVHRDAEVAAAAHRVAWGAYAYAGQVCISVQRILVHEEIADGFVSEFVRHVEEEMGVGDPRDEDAVCGPLIDDRNAARILEWIEEARDRGGTIRAGGTREGNVVRPTLMTDVPPDARLSCEEAFGPVATLETYADMADAIRRVNDSRFGLQAGVFTDSVEEVWRCFEDLDVGGVVHNDVPTFRVDHMPYGGVKDSGLGREGIPFAMEDFTELRLLALFPGPGG